MIAVIFEVCTKAEFKHEYLDIAAHLKPMLADVDGFISIERFQSLTDPAKLLSLSFWRDEDAVTAWRRQEEHRAAQNKGRARIFKDYRIRVATVIRNYTLSDRTEAPANGE
jgi:heme-degrading monooxygenase HmoA